MPEFFQTRMGMRFFESQLPSLITALEKIAEIGDALVRKAVAEPATPAPAMTYTVAHRDACDRVEGYIARGGTAMSTNDRRAFDIVLLLARKEVSRG